jgi:hypothetical protein
MKKTKPDILADIKYEPGEPGDCATDEQLIFVLTVIYKNFNKRSKNEKNNTTN